MENFKIIDGKKYGWNGEEYDFYLLAGGMIHAKKLDAAHHMLALRSISSVSNTVDGYLTAKKD